MLWVVADRCNFHDCLGLGLRLHLSGVLPESLLRKTTGCSWPKGAKAVRPLMDRAFSPCGPICFLKYLSGGKREVHHKLAVD